MPQAVPVADSSATVCSTLSGRCPTMTTLPPAATTSAATCRPMPLLPPITTSLRLVNCCAIFLLLT